QISMVSSLTVDGGINQVGYTVAGNGQPKYRGALQHVWSYGDFEVAVNTNYIHSYLDNAASLATPAGTTTTGSHTTHDLQVNYHAPWNGRMTVGIRNVGDKYPPLDLALLRSYDTQLYNAYGRQTYLRYT